MVQAALNDRIGNRPRTRNLSEISDIFEHRNRQIVNAHQKDAFEEILYAMFMTYLQSREGGGLAIDAGSTTPEAFSDYVKKRERFETLFTAAIMAMKDRALADLVNSMRGIFDEHHRQIREINRLADAVHAIQKRAAGVDDKPARTEADAVHVLGRLAPLKADLRAIESHCIEFRENRYLKAAAQYLENTLQTADRVIAEQGREASKLLFDSAGVVFHAFKSTPVNIAGMDGFMAQREELARCAKIFDSIGDEDRRAQIEGFITAIDGVLQKLRQEIERQKESEARLAEKHQQEISDAYERFLEIKELFAQGRLAADSQKKNAAEKLKKYRDTLIANGHRVMARDIDRFINATGIGRPAASPPRRPGAHEEETFDYRKGFLILLPITVVLFILVLAMLVL
jgi:hypothetical protein